ncbi:MAG: 3-deoxy-8-phosphooctulonate synthase [Candidatus Marinimicrobia bacterium]|nr:3-deoxy-8-phosphooctulonate synthase [Candidatus Neomarinimicrobiota bacterium]
MTVKIVKIGTVEFGTPDLPVIAGPCVIESREHTLRLAEALKTITGRLGLPFVFKSSFDKANRTAATAYRGPGCEAGLLILAEVKTQFNIPVLTDIHRPEQAQKVAQVVDAIQIPAFLCRQSDLLVAAAQTGKPVNVKKGQFLAPGDMQNVVQKLEQAGNRDILLTERGVQFGYNNLVSDMRSIAIMRKTGYPVIFDATHSAQLPGGKGDATGGIRQYIPVVARAAVAAGCDGIFLEVHDNPDQARSDSATQWPLDKLEQLLIELKMIRSTIQSFYSRLKTD